MVEASLVKLPYCECHCGLHWWWVNIGSGNGLVQSGNKPLPEPKLTPIYIDIWRHQATMINHMAAPRTSTEGDIEVCHWEMCVMIHQPVFKRQYLIVNTVHRTGVVWQFVPRFNNSVKKIFHCLLCSCIVYANLEIVHCGTCRSLGVKRTL